MSKFIGWLAKTSVGSMFGAVPPWVWYGMVALTLMMCGGWVNGMVWELKYDKHLAADNKAVALSEQVAKAKTEQNTAAINAARLQAFKQGETDAKTINDLRVDVLTGARRLRQPACNTNNADAGATVTASDGGRATDAQRDITDSARVVRLGEIGLTLANRLEEAQAVIKADSDAVNEKDKK